MEKEEVMMGWAARESHMGGIPRRLVILTVGALSKLYVSLLNSSSVYNGDTLIHLVKHRPPSTPLITVSNHMSTLDDPLMWGFRGFPSFDSHRARWILAAEDICFTNRFFSYFFRLGKCIPVKRGAGIYQIHMNEALDRVNEGKWLHTFPEGKICQDHPMTTRLKWGTASLIARAAVSPIVLPIAHIGFEKVMPEKYMFGRRSLLPLCFKNISIVVGEPMQFDILKLRQMAEFEASKSTPSVSPIPADALEGSLQGEVLERSPGDDPAVRWLHSHISDEIRLVLQDLFYKAKSLHMK